MSIQNEIEECIRRRGVRVDERRELVRVLCEDPACGSAELRRRLAEAEKKILDAAQKLRDQLR